MVSARDVPDSVTNESPTRKHPRRMNAKRACRSSVFEDHAPRGIPGARVIYEGTPAIVTGKGAFFSGQSPGGERTGRRFPEPLSRPRGTACPISHEKTDRAPAAFLKFGRPCSSWRGPPGSCWAPARAKPARGPMPRSAATGGAVGTGGTKGSGGEPRRPAAPRPPEGWRRRAAHRERAARRVRAALPPPEACRTPAAPSPPAARPVQGAPPTPAVSRARGARPRRAAPLERPAPRGTAAAAAGPEQRVRRHHRGRQDEAGVEPGQQPGRRRPHQVRYRG